LNRRKAASRARAAHSREPRPLTAKRERFVAAYTGEANGNQTEAARIAGFSRPSVDGTVLLADERVASAVADRTEHLAMGSAECLTRLASMARVDMGDYAGLVGQEDTASIRAELVRLQAQGKTHQIKRLTPTKYGLSVEMVDSQAALTTLAKHLGLLRDRLEIDVRPPSYDTAKIRALLQDPRGMELVCELDARLAAVDGAPLACEPSDGSSDLPAIEGPSGASVGPSAPNPPLGADS
jgi:hypothetical protein